MSVACRTGHEPPCVRGLRAPRHAGSREAQAGALLKSAWLLALLAVACAAADPAWAQDGAGKAAVCESCHGPSGNSVSPVIPKLAGQQAAYVAKQLTDMLDSKRTNEAMAAILPQISKDDIPALADYFAGQAQTPGQIEDQTLADAGRKLYEDGNTDSGVPACMGCHQPKGEGNDRYPRLAGQHKAYTQLQIANFKAGVRANDRGKVMRAVAERLSEQEIKAVTEYIAGM